MKLLCKSSSQRKKSVIKRCEVLLQDLHIGKKTERIKKLTKCRVELNNTDYINYIKQFEAKQISALLDKLEKESNMRETLINQRQGKLNKTRNSLAFGNTKVNNGPQPPQAEFLSTFYLKPSKKYLNPLVPKFSSNKVLKKICSVELSKDSDVDSGLSVDCSISVDSEKMGNNAPEMKEDIDLDVKESDTNQEKPVDVNVRNFSIDLIRMDVNDGGSTVTVADLFECTKCPRTFVKQGHLRKHIQRIHGASLDVDDSYEVSLSLDLSTGPTEHTCESCGIPFSTGSSLRRHEAIHHPLLVEPALVSPCKVQKKCTECCKQFQSQASLKRHILTEHRGFKSACPRCGLNVARLDNHIATVHGQGLSPCPVCSVLILPAHLTRHIKAVHLGYRQRCVLCDKFFSNLHKHVKSLHGVDHTDHADCSCVTFSGPHWGRAK